MRFSELLLYFQNSFQNSKQRPNELQTTFYRDNMKGMPFYQAKAQDAVQEYAPTHLSQNMSLFRLKIPEWEKEILKKKQKLTNTDIYYAHVLASLDVKNTSNSSHHCTGFFLYMAGVITHQLITKAGIPESFASRLISSAAHSFNNIEDPKALQLRNTMIGAIAIGGTFMLFCPSRLFSMFSKNITRFATSINQNPTVNHAYLMRGNLSMRPIKTLGLSLIGSSSLLFMDEKNASNIFQRTQSSEKLFQELYNKSMPTETMTHPENDPEEEMVHFILSLD